VQLLTGCNFSLDQGPSPAIPADKAIHLFEINSDLKIQLVASEPMVEDPVFTSFDEDGRLWVVEMRGFMTDIEGLREDDPSGRISILKDNDGDGRMDESTVYLDSLVMPRALAIVEGGALVVENSSLWWTKDLDGDLKADTKILIDPEYAGSDLPEHAGNGLLKGLDNWYYNAKSRFRYKLKNNQWIRDSTEFRGQWGISQDNYGRLFYNYNWSPVHADLVPPNYFSRNNNHRTTTGLDHGVTVDRKIYPIRENLAINRGYIPEILDDNKRLKEFTSACSPFYFRGDGLPGQYQDNVFVCEPSGNLIRRNKIISNGIRLSSITPDLKRSFLASHDERFRPVSLSSGPDGALYITDMYRGLIQHGAYISPYLKELTIERKLVHPTHFGRIWRITRKNHKPKPTPKLSSYAGPALVETLKHPDGWYRDTAQRLLVEKNDSLNLPLLENLALNSGNELGQIHALWTLEGMEKLNESTLFTLLEDPELRNEKVYIHAMRLAEQASEVNHAIKSRLEKVFLSNLRYTISEALALQMSISAGSLSPDVCNAVLFSILESTIADPIFRDAVLSSLFDREFAFLLFLMEQSTWQEETPAKAVFLEILSTAISHKNHPKEMQQMVEILDRRNPTKDWKALSIFTGMSMAATQKNALPTNLKKNPKFRSSPTFLESNLNTSPWDNLFNWPGKDLGKETLSGKNEMTAEEQVLFSKGRMHYLSTCAGCHGSNGEGVKRMAPPLNKSEWVTGNEIQLAMILLHGIEGPITVNGIKYNSPDILPVMPSMANLDNSTIAAILTYIRNEWNNQAKAVKSNTVAQTRISTQGRVYPWKPEDLLHYTPLVSHPKNLK
jgi:mono/diheme cytochrome c family protein/glucose/arabinose dehydrogenase